MVGSLSTARARRLIWWAKAFPLFFSVCVLAETNLTGERPFHTRTQEELGNDTDPAPHYTNWRRLKKTQYDPVPLNTATTVFNRIAISPVMDQS